ncbi:hypothetical protein EJ02DRAFT_453797 [Clathrospora elynae]|uniref:Uncharacterized protein n=1 Tax=Clathrospora elynae TaxID=706981 RepID=A0A6A5SWF1_9PLEO|nr:hypothetical protein EJ02DRAFT_453797 [Clathrospora elynae]
MVTPPHSTQDTLPLRPRLRRPSTYKPPAQRDIATIIEDDEPLDLTPPPKTLHEVTAEPEAPPPRPVPSRNFSRHFSSRFSVASAGSGDREEREGRRLSQMSATSSASEASDGRGGSRKSWGSAVSERWSVHTRGLVPLGVV